MDDIKSNVPFDVTDSSQNSAESCFAIKSGTTKDKTSLQSDLQIKNDSEQVLCAEESTIEEYQFSLSGKEDTSRKDNIQSEQVRNILTPALKTSVSLNDISEQNYDNHRIMFNNMNLSTESDIGRTTESISLSLPTVSALSSYTFPNVDSGNMVKTTVSSKSVFTNEQEIQFTESNAKSTYPFLETVSLTGNEALINREEMIQNTQSDNEELTKCPNTVKTIEGVTESTEQQCINNNKPMQSTIYTNNLKTVNNLTTRPTLADDSRLVKLSLPTNPINIMQSNSQFLNKSRNFLNFITEKSTNIMEKALLPQNLAVRYNPILKPIETSYRTERRSTNEFTNATAPTPNKPEFGSVNSTFTKLEASLTCNVRNNVVNNDGMPNDTVCDAEEADKGCNKKDTNTDTGENEDLSSVTSQNQLLLDNENNCISEENDKLSYSSNVNKETKSELALSKTFLNSELDNNHSVHKFLSDENPENINKDEFEISLDNFDSDMLQNSAYLNLIKNHLDLKTKYLKLIEKVQTLGESKTILEKERSTETIKIESLEKTIDKLTSELRLALATQELLKKDYVAANKERESMVMKYAVSEKQLIDAQRARDCAERKVKEVTKDQEFLQNKLRQAQGERTRICGILDGKCREVLNLQKEVEKLKEDVNIKDVKLKWSQSKLKSEMDMQKETQQKLDKALTRINDMKEECEQVRKETQESIRKFQQSEENKAVTLDQQLKEQQARLILERHVTEDKEMLRLQLQKEVEVLKNRQGVLLEENNTLSLKIQDAEKKRLQYESNLSDLSIVADQRQKEIVDLIAKVSELESTKLQLEHKEQRLATVEAEIEHLRLINEELQSDMSSCRQREAEMLDFTQKLTEKNVRLQSEFTAIEAKTQRLEKEQGPLHEQIHELNAKIKMLQSSVEEEQKKRTEECEILAKHLAEQTQLAQNLAQKLEDSQGENAVLKRKQQISMKEMTRELQHCRKRLEAYETASPSNSLDITSRTGSNTSLNTGDTMNGALSDHSANGDHTINSIELSKQALIDRIIKLQKTNVTQAERLDFFKGHTEALLEELQKKKKIIQNYILNESVGAMGSNERDRHKAELARHGGIMASVYNQKISDENITLELSLQMNHKLQAVLEDALLKNITLKDSIDTLGEEIARLTMQNQKRQITN